MENSTKAIIGGVVALLAIILLFILNPFTGVGAGERGVVLNWGAFNGQILQPGLHFRLPIVQSVYKINVQTQSTEIQKSEAYTKDLQMVDIHSVVNWNVKPESVGVYYQEYGAHFDNILVPRLESAVKQTVSKYTSEELLQKRGDIQNEIFINYQKSVPDIVNVTSYSLVDESFTQQYEQAIERKQIAQQDAEKAQNELKKVQIEAEQRVAKAKAEAEAIKIQAQAIQQQGGEEYVRLQWIEAWRAGGAKVPQVVNGGNGSGFIFNLNPNTTN